MFEQVKEIILEQLLCEDNGITEETTLVDLGADNLDLVEILISLEDEFDISLPSDLEEEIFTVGDLVRAVSERVD